MILPLADADNHPSSLMPFDIPDLFDADADEKERGDPHAPGNVRQTANAFMAARFHETMPFRPLFATR